jgi:hypothetical protein
MHSHEVSDDDADNAGGGEAVGEFDQGGGKMPVEFAGHGQIPKGSKNAAGRRYKKIVFEQELGQKFP